MAILGASGAVGQELLQLLKERCFPVKELRLLASARSAGTRCSWNGTELTVQEVSTAAFEGVDLCWPLPVDLYRGSGVKQLWRQGP